MKRFFAKHDRFIEKDFYKERETKIMICHRDESET